MDQQFCMTVNNQAEADFLLKHLKPEHTVLEWGAGASTLEIAKHVKKLCSIEHEHNWFERVAAKIPQNVHICHVPHNSPEGKEEDGTYEQYQNYVDKALDLAQHHGKFDVIFIDGRARVACAAICEQVAHKDTLVFIHDYNHPDKKYLREEYFAAEEFLTRLEGEFTMWKFSIKAFDEKPENLEVFAASEGLLQRIKKAFKK